MIARAVSPHAAKLQSLIDEERNSERASSANSPATTGKRVTPAADTAKLAKGKIIAALARIVALPIREIPDKSADHIEFISRHGVMNYVICIREAVYELSDSKIIERCARACEKKDGRPLF